MSIKELPAELLIEFYERFIKNFELQLNLLRLSQIIITISSRLTDGKKATFFLEEFYNRIEGARQKQQTSQQELTEALVILKIQMALWTLRLADPLECKKILDQCKERIDKVGYVDNVVNAIYHRACAEYYKVVDDANEFYSSALLYLAYTPIEKIELRNQQLIAFDLGIAALLGDRIYNFGELLGHPVIESLNGTEAEWLVKLLFAFNRGSIRDYQQYHQYIDSNPSLTARKPFLEEKMRLMAVMELVFSRPIENRSIPFSDIAVATGASMEQVEPLLLKALAYDLIRGIIDEVDQTVHVKWVQPRILDKNQIVNLKQKIGNWLEKVDKTLVYLEEHGSNELTINS